MITREIKVVFDVRTPKVYHVKNVGNQLAKNERLAAARWQDQDGGIKVFGSSNEACEFLAACSGVENVFDVSTNSSFDEFVEWENDQFRHNWQNWEEHPDQQRRVR